jgi:hypothetical protein
MTNYPAPDITRPATMSDLYKCVIKTNTKTYALKSLPVEVLQGLHWIVDGSGKLPDQVIIPPGRQVIEAFSIDPAGNHIVHETLIVGLGTIQGPLPASYPDGTIRLTANQITPLAEPAP